MIDSIEPEVTGYKYYKDWYLQYILHYLLEFKQ